jgi:hypothetical protein
MTACTCSPRQLEQVGCDCAASHPTLRIEVASWIGLTAPDPEDGQRREHLTWLVRATADDGERFDHVRSFNDEAGAIMLAAKVRATLDRGGHLNMDHWQEADPAYGSEAYQRAERAGDLRPEPEDGEGFSFHANGGWR